jgi:hypothetical protein
MHAAQGIQPVRRAARRQPAAATHALRPCAAPCPPTCRCARDPLLNPNASPHPIHPPDATAYTGVYKNLDLVSCFCMSHPKPTSEVIKPIVWPTDPGQLPGGFVVSGWQPLMWKSPSAPSTNVPEQRIRWRGCRCWFKNADGGRNSTTALAYAVAYCH